MEPHKLSLSSFQACGSTIFQGKAKGALLAQGVLQVEHVSTHDNVADLLTKPLQQNAFEKHRAHAMNLSQRGGC